MTDQELKDLVASLAIGNKELRESQAKTDELMKKTEVEIAKMSQKVDKIADMFGSFGRNLGEITEEFFFNALSKTQMLGGIHYDFIDKNLTRSSGKVQDEFDIVMVNGKDVAIIEVKYKAHETDLTKLLTKKHNNFKKLFPIYKDYQHHLVLASFSIYDQLKEQALSQGVMVLQRTGDVIESFEPA